MNQKIKNLVLEWFGEKIRNGEPDFDVITCIKDIGLDPLNKYDLEMVDEIFHRNEQLLNDYFYYDITSNT
jgi:hypothetical protein